MEGINEEFEISRIASLRSIPEDDVFETVLCHSIVDDVIAAHRRHPNGRVKFAVEGEEAVGDGVHRDTMSHFFKEVMDDGFDGTDEQVPNISAEHLSGGETRKTSGPTSGQQHLDLVSPFSPNMLMLWGNEQNNDSDISNFSC